MKHYKLVLLLVLSLFTPIASAFAQISTEKLKQIKKQADAGEPFALYLVAGMYEQGTNGFEKSTKKALKYYTEAIKKKYDSAYFDLGRFYEEGIEFPIDYQKAAENYLKAAKVGHGYAQYKYALLLETGKLNFEDDKTAVNIYLEQYKLNGISEAKDRLLSNPSLLQKADTTSESYVYYMAYVKNSPYHDTKLARAYQMQRYSDTKTIFSLYLNAAQQEYLPAIFEVGKCYANGIGVSPSVPDAIKYYLKAGNLGYIEADNELKFYDIDKYLAPNDIAYLQYKARVAPIGKASGAEMYQLYKRYLTGDGVAQDEQKAIEYCEKAGLSNYMPAMMEMARLYEQGVYVKQDLSASFLWYLRAAYQNNDTAHYMLGEMYASGRGTDKDMREAVSHYLTAANGGYPLAQNRLEQIKIKDYISETDVEYVTYRAKFKNDRDAMLRLAKFHLANTSASREDITQSIDFLTKLADGNNTEAQAILGSIYMNGSYMVKQNTNKATEYLLKSSAKGNLLAITSIASMYNKGSLSAIAENQLTATFMKANELLVTLREKSADSLMMSFYKEMANVYLKKQDFANVAFFLTEFITKYQDSFNRPVDIVTSIQARGLAFAQIGRNEQAINDFEVALLLLEENAKHVDFQFQFDYLKGEILKEKAKVLLAAKEMERTCETVKEIQQLGLPVSKELESNCIGK